MNCQSIFYANRDYIKKNRLLKKQFTRIISQKKLNSTVVFKKYKGIINYTNKECFWNIRWGIIIEPTLQHWEFAFPNRYVKPPFSRGRQKYGTEYPPIGR